MQRMSESLMRNRNCDITILVKGSSFTAHKSLLQEHSRFLRKKIELGNGNISEIILNDVNETGMKWCIEYMYSGECPPRSFDPTSDLSDIVTALEVANHLQMVNVPEKCLDFLLHCQTPENCLEAVRILEEYGDERRVEEARGYVKANLSEVAKQEAFLKLTKSDFSRYIRESGTTPTVIWKAVTSWIEHEPTRKQYLSESLDFLFSSDMDVTPILLDIIGYAEVRKESTLFTRVSRELEKQETRLVKNMTTDSSVELLKLTYSTNSLTEGVAERLRNASEIFLANHIDHAKVRCNDLNFAEFNGVLRNIESRDDILWELIVSWIKHDKARHAHLLDLIKIMDIRILTLKFISTEMRPIIRSSIDCLNYILDHILETVNLKQPKEIPKLAMFDDHSKLLMILDTSTNTHAEIKAPPTKSVSRVTSIDGELFLLQGAVLRKLMLNGTWEKLTEFEGCSQSWTQFISFRNQLCLVSNESLLLYNLMDRREISSTGCMLGRGFSSASSSTCIYALGGYDSPYQAKLYTSENGWEDLPEMSECGSYSALIYFKSKLYVFGGRHMGLKSNTVRYFDGEAWTILRSMLRKRSHFAATVYRGKMMVIGGSKRLFRSDDHIEEYNIEADSWRQIGRTAVGVFSLGTCQVDTTAVSFTCRERGNIPDLTISE